MLNVREAKHQDVHRMLPRVCPRDVKEAGDLFGVSILLAMEESFRQSNYVRVVTEGSKILCMFGLIPPATLLGDAARPWVVSSADAFRYVREWLKLPEIYLGEMLARNHTLENWADARHTVRLRWLRRLGFTIYEPSPYGPLGLPACRFRIERKQL